MQPVWTPTEASWLNAIEAHFGALKRATLTNSADLEHVVCRRRIYRYLRYRNRRVGQMHHPLTRVRSVRPIKLERQKSFRNAPGDEECTGEAKEAPVRGEQTIVANSQLKGVAEPAERVLHDPATPVPAQDPAAQVDRLRVVPLGRDDRPNPPALEILAQGIAVVAAVGDKALGAPRERHTRQGLHQDRDLRRGRCVQVCSERSTRAIDQYHRLRALALLGRANLIVACFVGAKPPSTKPSFERSFWRSLRACSSARQSASQTRDASRSFTRRQQVVIAALLTAGNLGLSGALSAWFLALFDLL